tara:strand:+ start:84 stop:254 length:171 start_codon:yes stop_codon:yes gene_type:complete
LTKIAPDPEYETRPKTPTKEEVSPFKKSEKLNTEDSKKEKSGTEEKKKEKSSNPWA